MDFYELHERVVRTWQSGYFDRACLSTCEESYDEVVTLLAKIIRVDRSLVDFLARSIIEYQDDWMYEKTVEEVQSMLADGYFDEHSVSEAADYLSDKLSDTYSLVNISPKVIQAIVEAETEDEE